MIPADFQFTDNPDVNAFAIARAELMFGKDWKNQSNLKFLPSSHGVRLKIIGEASVRTLLVVQQTIYPEYEISCLKNNVQEDPTVNVAAVTRFSADGKPAYQAHYAGGCAINPPDGSPAHINYTDDGGLSEAWYAYDHGTLGCGPATKAEIAKRMHDAKCATLTELCEGEQNIVVLRPGRSPSTEPTSSTRSMG